MTLSVAVRDYAGELVARSTNPGIGPLCDVAAELGLPFLASVDRYDDTSFNRNQMRAIRAEVDSLLEDESEMVRRAASELLELCEIVDRRPHRYLIFNGD
jgi:hypothetical protein